MSLAGTGYFDVESSTPVIFGAIDFVVGPLGSEYGNAERHSKAEQICKSILKSRHTYVQRLLKQIREYSGPPAQAPKLNVKYPSPGQQTYIDNYVRNFGRNSSHAIMVHSGDEGDTEHAAVVTKVKKEQKQDENTSSSEGITTTNVKKLFEDSTTDSATEEETVSVTT